jgi:drug/metabolite transporter (DMT)-like permease
MEQRGNRPLAKTYMLTILAIVLWGFSFVWTNDILQKDIPVFTFLFIRLALAGTLLFAFAKLTGKLQPIAKKDVKFLILMAFFEPFIYFIGETYGIKATNSAVLSAVIIATIPIVSLFVENILYKVPYTAFKIFGTAITIPGIVMVIMKSGETTSVEHTYGIALLFLAVAGSIGYSSVVKKLSGNYNPLTITTYQFVIGSVFFLPFFLGWGLDGVNGTLLTREILVPLLSLAVLCSCLAFFCWVNAIRDLGMTKTNIFSALIPAVSALGAAMLGQEQITLMSVVGITVVTTGVIIAQKG